MSTLKEDIETLKVPKKYQKAIYGAIGAVAPVVIFSLSDGHISGPELGAIITAGLGAFGITFKVPNKEVKPKLTKEEVGKVNEKVQEANEQLKLDL